jgi:chromosome segregation ATPase
VSDPNQAYGAAPSGAGLKIPILFGAVIALVAANVYLFLQVDNMRTDMAKMKEAILTEISNVRETSTVTTQSAKRNIEALKEELEAARRQAAMAAGNAKTDAQKHAEELAQRLAAEQARFKQAQALQAQELSAVKETASSTSAKLGEVSTEVGSVKSEVASTKSELEKTIADLKRVNGDLGVQSGLIATNGRELAALKQLGERNIFEFNLKKTKEPQKVGDITVFLKKTDTKRNKYTIEVVADDKKVEKKDKNINEPVQFYTAKARIPYEIVVNDVKKDNIVGYLSTPKVQSVRN